MMDTQNIVSKSSATRHVIKALIMGSEDANKHLLARALVDVDKLGGLQVRTSAMKSFPQKLQTAHTGVDFIIIIINQSSKLSFAVGQSSLPKLDVSHYLGKVAFVVTHSGDTIKNAIDMVPINSMADCYGSPLFYMNIDRAGDLVRVAKKLLNFIHSGCKYQTSASPIIF